VARGTNRGTFSQIGNDAMGRSCGDITRSLLTVNASYSKDHWVVVEQIIKAVETGFLVEPGEFEVTVYFREHVLRRSITSTVKIVMDWMKDNHPHMYIAESRMVPFATSKLESTYYDTLKVLEKKLSATEKNTMDALLRRTLAPQVLIIDVKPVGLKELVYGEPNR
jgi:hypothetical protein